MRYACLTHSYIPLVPFMRDTRCLLSSWIHFSIPLRPIPKSLRVVRVKRLNCCQRSPLLIAKPLKNIKLVINLHLQEKQDGSVWGALKQQSEKFVVSKKRRENWIKTLCFLKSGLGLGNSVNKFTAAFGNLSIVKATESEPALIYRYYTNTGHSSVFCSLLWMTVSILHFKTMHPIITEIPYYHSL